MGCLVAGDIVGSAKIRIEGDTSTLTRDVQRGGRQILGDFRGLAGAITGIFAGIKIAGFLRDGIREVAELDTAIREVGTLLGRDAVDAGALDFIRSGVQDLALEFGTLSNVAVPAVYQALSAGVPAGNVFDFLADANRAAIAGVTDLETATSTIAGLVNAFGVDTLSASDASDILFTTIRGGITNFEQLASSLSQVTPTAAALGVGFDEIGAAMATITQQGTPTAQAAVGLNQVLAELGRSSTRVAQLFQELSGQSFPDFIAQGGTLQEALALIDQEAENSGRSMLDLFSSVQAGRAAMQLTGSAAKTGLVGFAAALPLVLAGVFGGPFTGGGSGHRGSP
jgi:TP901 family phage tail tape measure protein